MRKPALILLGIACGCGRIGFDPLGDGAPAELPQVALAAVGLDTGAVFVVSGATVAAGDLVVVASGNYNVGVPIASIIDNGGNTYVSAGAKATWATADSNVVEIWYARAVAAASSWTISNTGAGASSRQYWILDVAGADATAPLDVVATRSDAPASAMPSAPTVTPTAFPSVVISAGNFVSTLSGLAPGAPFTALPIQTDNDAAYYIATLPGAYGAVWVDTVGNSYCTSTAAFKAAGAR